MFIHGQTSTTDVRRNVTLNERLGVTSTSASPNDGVIFVDEDFTITEDDERSTFVVDTDGGDVVAEIDVDNFPLPEHFRVQVLNRGSGVVNFSSVGGTSFKTLSNDTVSSAERLNARVVVRHLKDGEILLRGDLDSKTIEVSTDAATSVGTNSATLNGSLDTFDNFGDDADVSFEWGQQGNSLPNTENAGTLASPGVFDANLSGLTSGTTYEFRAVAESEGIRAEGAILTFTTT